MILINLANGFLQVFQPFNLLMLFIGLLVGMAVSIMPGLGLVMGVVLALPFTYQMSIEPSVILLTAIYFAGTYAGCFTAILYRIPGEPMDVPMLWDGYTMAARGHPAKALGWALVAATERGICMTALADDRDKLEASLRQRFPAATVIPDNAGLKDWADRIVGFITDPDRNLDLPLDIQGTAFQARVWRALQKIPLGKTASYTEIAAALGRPKAVRAVAQACAANKVALLVPCHRVIRSDGGIGGYRWGPERKRALLDRELAAVAPDEAAA